MDIAHIASSNIFDIEYMGKARRVRVSVLNSASSEISPDCLYLVTRSTVVNLESHKGSQRATGDIHGKKTKPIGYRNIGGLANQINIVREMVEISLQKPELFQNYGNY